VLQCVAVCCIVLQCRVVWCIVLQCAAVHSTHSHVQVRSTKRQILAFGHGSVLQSAAVCCCVLRCVAGCSRVWQCVAVSRSVLWCITRVYTLQICSTARQIVCQFGLCVLQCVAMCCSVLQQRVAVCRSAQNVFKLCRFAVRRVELCANSECACYNVLRRVAACCSA